MTTPTTPKHGMAQDGYKPQPPRLTEGYQPVQKGYQPQAGASPTGGTPPSPPTGGSSAMTPQGPQASQGGPSQPKGR